MSFRDILVKDALANEQIKSILEKHVPGISKNPALKLMGKKTCGEVLDLIVSKGMVGKELVQEVEKEIDSIIK